MIIYLKDYMAKAKITGGAVGDLFATPVTVEGYTTKDGTVVPTHTAVRHKHAETPPPAPRPAPAADLFSMPPKPLKVIAAAPEKAAAAPVVPPDEPVLVQEGVPHIEHPIPPAPVPASTTQNPKETAEKTPDPVPVSTTVAAPAEPVVWGVPAGTKPAARKKLNKAALAILAAKTNAQMTPADRAALAQYTGNGGAGVGDSLNEFYTEPAVAEAMWQILANAGFRGGEVLEPSCGTGVFLHTAPAGAHVTGVEISPISARIAEILHPDHDVRASSMERFACQDGQEFDAVIGNAPFGTRGSSVSQDPQKSKLTSHEAYFTDTSLDKLKDGGLLALIVNTSIMNGPNSRGLRERLLRKAEFLGAHRLPTSAFAAAHTSTVTDIMLFRKRPADVAGALGTVTQDQLKAVGAWDEDFLGGKYFEGRGAPFVYGTVGTAMREYGPIETVTGSMDGVPEHLAAWRPEPASTQPDMPRIMAELAHDPKAQKRAADAAQKRPYQAAVVGDVRTMDGVRYILQGEPPRWHKLDANVPTVVQDAMKISEGLQALLDGRAKEPSLTRAEVAEGLDEFISQHGAPLKNRELVAWIESPSLDPEEGEGAADLRARVQATKQRVSKVLGAVNKDGSYSDIISGNLGEQTEAGLDSVAAKLGADSPQWTVDQLAAHSGRTAESVLDHLHASPNFAIDADGKTWSTLDTYLSGELWPKLDAAKAAAAHEGVAPEYKRKYEMQARALEEVIAPASLEDTEIVLNSGFVTPENINAFYAERHAQWMADNPGASWTPKPITVRYDDGVYEIGGDEHNAERKMLDRYFNRTGVRKDERLDLDTLNEEFAEWARTGPMRDEIENRYNRTTKGFRQLEYSSAPMVIPGLTTAFDINGYHYSGLRWALSTGKGIIADDVGLGKTGRGLMLAKLARLHGTATKPAIVVPLAVLGNWAEETQTWFPGSRVLVIGETYEQNPDGTFKRDASGKLVGKSDTEAQRRAKFHQLQQNNYDFVLVSKPAWNKIDLSPITKGQYSADEFWNKRGEKLGNAGSKKVNKVRDAFEQAQANREFQDREDTIYFDDLGIDMLIMDEGHAYKNLFKANNRFGMSPKFLGGSGESNTAMDTYFKSKFVREKNDGKGVYLMTATPTKNSPLEVYSMLSHIAPEAFEHMGIKNSEEFIDRFVEFVPEDIYSVSGEFEPALVTAGFKNLGELREVMRRYISRRTAEEVGLELPEAENHEHLLNMSPAQEEKYQDLRALALASKSGDATGDAHIFSIMDKMQKASTDLRLLGAEYNGERSPKIEKVADEAVAGSADGGQIIFCEHVDEHDRIADALVKRGIPADQIAIINAVVTKSSADRQRVSDRFNKGIVKFVIGNKTMEEGVNLQKLTSDMHHVDLPWNPSTMHQRNGRGRRQGNKRAKIRIHTYMAKKSFDVYRHQTIAAKANWTDLLWNGGDRVENLERDGQFSLKDLSCMMADDPEAALVKFNADKGAAMQRKLVSERVKAAESFRRIRSMSSNLAKLHAAGRGKTEGAARLQTKLDRARELLEHNQHFAHKDLIHSNEPAVIEPVSGVAWRRGMGADIEPGSSAPVIVHGDTPERFVVAYVDEGAKKVYMRSLADKREFPVSLTTTHLQSGVTPFTVTPAIEAEARAHYLATVGEKEAKGAKTFKDIYRLPPETAERHFKMLQSRLRASSQSFKDEVPSNIAMVGPDGAGTVVNKYQPKGMTDHHFMLPTAEHREAAITGWVNDRMARTLHNRYAAHKRGHYGRQEVTGIDSVYPGSHGGGNSWHEPIKDIFGHDAKPMMLEGRDRVTARAAQNVAATTNLYDAFTAASKAVNVGSIKGGGGWPAPVVRALYEKAKALGNLDMPFHPQVKKTTRSGGYYSGAQVDHAGHQRLYTHGSRGDFLREDADPATGRVPTVRDFLAAIARDGAMAENQEGAPAPAEAT